MDRLLVGWTSCWLDKLLDRLWDGQLVGWTSRWLDELQCCYVYIEYKYYRYREAIGAYEWDRNRLGVDVDDGCW